MLKVSLETLVNIQVVCYHGATNCSSETVIMTEICKYMYIIIGWQMTLIMYIYTEYVDVVE